MNLKILLAIGLGGAIGTLLRYVLNVYTLTVGYPIGTMLENLFGSLLLGMLTGFFLYRIVPDWLKLGLGVGLCGGFTTMSTLAADAVFLSTHYPVYYPLLYVAISVIGGVAAAFIGFRLGEGAGKRATVKEGGEQR